MANPFKTAAEQRKVPPGGKEKSVVEVVEPKEDITPTPKVVENPIAGAIEQKPEGKSYGFYLSVEAAKNLERLAAQNGCSKSKALDALLRGLYK